MENTSTSPVGAALPSSDSLSVQETEKQLWEIVKSIPGLNVTYGTVRCIVYVIKKDDKESTASAIAAAKGAVQTAVITAGIVTAPVSIPVAAGGALTGIAAKSVTDTLEILVFFVTNTEQLHGKKNDDRERIFYDRIKNVTGIGALYSVVRVPVCFLKKNRQQTIESGIGFVANSGDTAVQVGVSMIPNVDEQVRKLIEKTARCAIKYLAKSVIDQTSRQNLPIEQGLHTLAKVENDCQTIMEATNGQIEELPPTGNGDQSQQNMAKNIQEKSTERRTKCTCFSWCCCFKSNARRKVQPTSSHSAPIHETCENTKDTLENHGHLIILTE